MKEVKDMKTVQKSLRVPTEVAKAIEELSEVKGQDFSATAIELLDEAIKMRRCPGIVFADVSEPGPRSGASQGSLLLAFRGSTPGRARILCRFPGGNRPAYRLERTLD
jgi:hypothetical protein